MNTFEKAFATVFLAIAWESCLLLVSVNSSHINKHVPAVMAICSGVVVLFFLHAFDPDLGWLTLVQRYFIGILVALVNWLYTEIFHAKWKERISVNDAPAQVIELRSTVDHLRSVVIEADSKLKELDELKRYRAKIIKELTCPHCRTEQSSFGSLHAHKGHCSLNPRNLVKEKISDGGLGE